MAKTTSVLAQATLSRLVVVDMQDKIASVMQAEAMGKVVKHCNILLQAAALLEIPADRFNFPLQSVESVTPVDDFTLLVGLDKEYAMVRDRVGDIERFWRATRAVTARSPR